jgi:hypothetical protein
MIFKVIVCLMPIVVFVLLTLLGYVVTLLNRHTREVALMKAGGENASWRRPGDIVPR